jgi:hypothetical protein
MALCNPSQKCHQTVHKLITSLNSERYPPSGVLIHRKNSYAANGALVTVKRRAVEPVNKIKIIPA